MIGRIIFTFNDNTLQVVGILIASDRFVFCISSGESTYRINFTISHNYRLS